MTVTNFTVSFRRSRQPASYETAEPAVSFSGALEPGEDTSAAWAAMLEAQRMVYAGLGMDIPASVLERFAAPSPAATGAAAPKSTSAAPTKKTTLKKPRVEEPAPVEVVNSEDPTAAEITDDDLVEAAQEAAKKFTAAWVRKLRDSYGVTQLASLPQDKRAEAVAAMKEGPKE